MERKESNSSEEKGVPQSTITDRVVHSSHSPRASLSDEAEALARKVFLKFDLLLVLPTLIMFCEYQCK